MLYDERKELEMIMKRCESATKGPWVSYIEGRDHTSGSSFIKTSENDIELIGARSICLYVRIFIREENYGY